MVRKFAETEIKPIAAELDHTHRHPEEICRKLGEMGIMGVSVPTEYGGAGMDNVTYVISHDRDFQGLRELRCDRVR